MDVVAVVDTYLAEHTKSIVDQAVPTDTIRRQGEYLPYVSLDEGTSYIQRRCQLEVWS